MVDASVTGNRTGRWQAWRARIAARPALNLGYRMGVGVLGALVLAAGLIAIPYPGPGWLIVFAGLGILASEFAWAKTVLRWVKARYDRFMLWFGRQGWWARAAGVLFTAAIVAVTLWLLGTAGFVADWFGFGQAWLRSPL